MAGSLSTLAAGLEPRRVLVSRSELQRLVLQAERHPRLRRSLKRCRSRQELLVTARRLGFGVTEVDLVRARAEERAVGRSTTGSPA